MYRFGPLQERLLDQHEERKLTLVDGTRVPCIGQGTWYMGEDPGQKEKEIEALRLGAELGTTLIDTAEMYANGGAERVVGEAIKGIRDDIFLVSKVYPHNAGLDSIAKACENSLKRLGTDHLDLYLLHWRGQIPLQETIEGMEKLKKDGKILRWGVSNFDTEDMEELWSLPDGNKCAVNQVLYHLGSRGIEFDLLPWHQEHQIPVMAYSPLAQGGSLKNQLLTDPFLKELGVKHQTTPLVVALAWTIRSSNVIAIPKAVKELNVIRNAEAVYIEFTQEELDRLDKIFPGPNRKMPLDII